MPSHFVFRLQRLLDLRELQKQECQKRLAIAINAVMVALADLQILQTEREELNAAWQQTIVHGLRPETAVNFQRCFENSTVSCMRATQQLDAARKEELACRALLEKALHKQKVLEKLRDRNQTRFTTDANRREQAQLDDFAMLRQSREKRQ